MAKVERLCKVCGSIFFVKPSSMKFGRGETCSRACQYQSMRRRVTLICKTCEKPFEVKQSDFDYRVRIGEPPTYCSRRCAHESPEWKENLGESLRNSPIAKEKRAHAIAAMNADAQTPEGRERRRRQTKRQMTDPEMRAAWEAAVARRSVDPVWQASPQFRRGEAHAAYRGNKPARDTAMARYEYKVWRTAVFTRDDYTCRECGVRGGYLHAHHIKPWATHPELRLVVENGVTLCRRCHYALHSATARQ